MRICIFSDTYTPETNGVATSVHNLFTTLKNHGEEVLLVVTNHFGNKTEYEDGVLRIAAATLKKFYDYRLAFVYNGKAYKIIKDFNPDVIHVNTDAGLGQFGFIAASKLRVPVVWTYHTMLEDYTYYASNIISFDRVIKAAVRGYIRFKTRISDEFIAPSGKIHEYMRSIGVDGYINVVPTGIDYSFFDEEKLDKDKLKNLKKDLGIDEDDFVILSLGRVAREKSVDLTIKAYKKFLDNNPGVKAKFLVVGGGPELDLFKSLAEELQLGDKIVFVGPVDPNETPYYYHLAKCFVSASLTETQGLTFLEALASSCVVLARYDDNLKNLIKDGVDGYFYLDEDDLAKHFALVRSLSEEDKKAILKNASSFMEPYSMDAFYSNIMESYERAVKKNW